MRKTHLLTAAATFLLLTLPAVSAFACGNSMSGSSSGGLGLPGAWLVGLFLHFVTLPAVGRDLTARLASLGTCLGGATLFGIWIDLRLFPMHIFLGFLVFVLVSAVVILYLVKNREYVAEEERIRAETAPQVFE